MALHHASSGKRIDIRPLRDALKTSRSTTLYKSEHLEVFRLVLLAGKGMPEHRAIGEVTVQCLEGSIAFSIGSASEVMRQGDLKCLSGGEPHALMAIEDSSVLVTLLLHGVSAGAPPVPADFKVALRSSFDGLFILSDEFDHASAEQTLLDKRGDLIAFGRPFLANPDLVARMCVDAPQNTPDATTFYVAGSKGYTDYPAMAA